MLDLRPFQRRFLARALAPDIDTAALSIPRGNGKSALAAHVAVRCLTPDDRLFTSGAEVVLVAASIPQAVRGVFTPARKWLEGDPDYRFADSANRASITHLPTKTKLTVISSSGTGAMGLVGVPLVLADEPGAWQVNNGQLLHDAIQTAQGKPGSDLRAIYIGTLAPATGGWWHELIADGSHGSTYVQALQGDRERWEQWPEIRRCNPLTMVSAKFRRKLIEERDAARRDSRLKARFLSYRLNRPTGDESSMLLTVDDWEHVEARAVPAREGKPIVGVDLGGGRAWSAAVACWRNGRCEALAVAPGIPSIAAQEKRDRVPAGTYARLVDSGALSVSAGLRVQPAGHLWEFLTSAWGVPEVIVCDRFRINELRDCVNGACPLSPRVTRWSESAADIRATRKMARDGPLAVEPGSRALLVASLAAAAVQNDDAGNFRLVKRDQANNTSRDDVAAALTLACGAVQRAPSGSGFRYLGAA